MLAILVPHPRDIGLVSPTDKHQHDKGAAETDRLLQAQDANTLDKVGYLTSPCWPLESR